MNDSELLKRIFAYGADEEGIRDRFCDNAELYELCFREFLEEPHFAELAQALADKNYPQAFDAAHALKGLSGNLGVSAFYAAICTLVESLRAQRYDNIALEYGEVQRQYHNLQRIASGLDAQQDGVPPPAADTAASSSSADKSLADKEKSTRYMLISIAVTLAVLALVSILFGKMISDYRENIVVASGQHLTEMSNQVRLYIEEQVANDWRIAHSVGDSITDGNYADDDAAIFNMLQRKQQVWGVSDLMLYTESGYCVYADGSTEKNDVASDTIVKARDQGTYMSVIDSKIIYTVPLETTLRYNGAELAAVSVVRNMATFLDEMKFSAFDESAWMYLTAQNGTVISMLTNDSAVAAFNFKSVVSDKDITPLSSDYAAAELFSSAESSAFLVADDKQQDYVISVPVYTGAEPLRLYYLAPEATVNHTMTCFPAS